MIARLALALLIASTACTVGVQRAARSSMQAIAAGAYICDHMQTETALDRGMRENNFVLGSAPAPAVSLGALAISLAAVAAIGTLPEKRIPLWYQNLMIGTLLVVETAVVYANSVRLDEPMWRCGR